MDTDPVAIAAEQLSSAREAHDQATANHKEALARAGRAAELHRGAALQRQTMLNRAAGGEAVGEEDLRRADSAAAEARDTADLHRSIADGAMKKVHIAEIAVLNAQVADHDARRVRASTAAAEAALEIDRGIAAVRSLIAGYQGSLANLRVLGDEANVFNTFTMDEARSRNSELTTIHLSQHPKKTPVAVTQAALTVQLLAGQRPGFIGDATIVPSMAPFAAGLAPKTPAPTTKGA